MGGFPGRVTLIAILVLTAILSGCAQQGATGLDAIVEQVPPTASVVSLTIDWSKDRHDFHVRLADASTAPLISLEIHDRTSDARATIEGSDLRLDPVAGAHKVVNTVPIVADHFYSIRVISAGNTIHERVFTAGGDKDFLPANYRGNATYAVAFASKNETQGNKSSEDFSGTAKLEALDHLKRETIAGTGAISSDDGDMLLTFSNIQVSAVTENDVTKSLVMASNSGAWTMRGPEFTGSGWVEQFRMESQGGEAKADKAGIVHRTEKSYTTFVMQGTVYHPDATMDLYGNHKEWTWEQPETGQAIWEKEDSLTRVIHPNTRQTIYEEPTIYDGPPREDDEGDSNESASLGDIIDGLQGLFAQPAQAGDRIGVEGLEGFRIHYVVAAGGALALAGTSLETLRFDGVVLSGGVGKDTIHFAKDGPLDGVPIKREQSFRRGLEDGWQRMTLSKIG